MRHNLRWRSSERDAERWHELLDRLDRAGYDVAEFRLDPDRDMHYPVTTVSGQGVKSRTKDRKVRSGVLESKMGAALMRFRLAAEKRQIGFDAARKS